MSYEIGQTFEDRYPPEAAIWCNGNDCQIEQSGNIFTIIKNPEYIPTTEDKIYEYESYLKSTDWYVIRKSETGVEIPADIIENRANAREQISILRGE